MSDTKADKKVALAPGERKAEIEAEITAIYGKFSVEGNLVRKASMQKSMDALLDEWNEITNKLKSDELQPTREGRDAAVD